MADLLDDVDRMADKMVEQGKKQKQILEQIDRVEQPYRLILEKVYILGKSLVTVASEMCYNYEYMRHMHGKALNKFDEAGG